MKYLYEKLKSHKIKAAIAIAILIFIGGISVFTFSKSNSSENKYYDKQFMNSLSKGLENRWRLADQKSFKSTKNNYTKLVNSELDSIQSYTDKHFKSSELQENAISYINALKATKKTLNTYGSDSFESSWNNSQDNRYVKLKKINSINKIIVKKQYQDYLDELLGSGTEVNNKNKQKDTLDALIKTISFTSKDKDYDSEYTDYEATVKSTTSYDYSQFGLSVKLIDDAGVTVETTYVSTDNFNSGDTTKLDFSSDKKFSKIELSDSYSTVKQ